MPNVFDVANVLIADSVQHYGDQIDIIGYYGSHARGEAHDWSDLDMFYIPADGAKPPVARTFLFDGVLFDFWAIRWETMEGFASGRIRGWAFAPGLVADATVLHARSDQHVDRLKALKQLVLDLQSPASRPEMICRAISEFSGNVMTFMGNVRLAAAEGDIADLRYAGLMVAQSVWECLAMANQVFFRRGFVKSLDQIDRFEHRPTDMGDLVATITSSSVPSEVADACERITNETRGILRRLQETIERRTTVEARMKGTYPELKDMVRKVLAACDRGDMAAARTEAMFLQVDLTMMLNDTRDGGGHRGFNRLGELAVAYGEAGFPDLVTATSTERLAAQVRRLDGHLREWLVERNVDLCEYRTLSELRERL